MTVDSLFGFCSSIVIWSTKKWWRLERFPATSHGNAHYAIIPVVSANQFHFLHASAVKPPVAFVWFLQLHCWYVHTLYLFSEQYSLRINLYSGDDMFSPHFLTFHF